MNTHTTQNLYDYTYKPRRIWIDKFSKKPNYLMLALSVAITISLLLLLGYLVRRADNISGRNLCMSWKNATLEQKAYCKNYGVIFKTK